MVVPMPESLFAFVLVVAVAVGIGVLVGLLVGQRLSTGGRLGANDAHDELMGGIDQLADVLRHERGEAIHATLDTVLSVASSKLGDQLETGRQVLGYERETIAAKVEVVNTELRRVGNLVAELQKERAQQSGQFQSGLEQATRVTAALADTTASLREALASPQARGQWGERLAEDVLNAAGFVEGVSYRKQAKLAGGSVPDYTFLLPKGHVVHMDVKFPLDNYLRWLEANDDAAKATHLRSFKRDVRQRVKELETRSYIDAETTVDYLLLFVPNESVYGFVHQNDPNLLDEALGRKVVLCSPTTLFAVLAVIRQAVDNFLVERQSGEILGVLGALRDQWEKWAEPMDKMRRGLDSAQKAFDELSGPRTRQFQRQLEKLESVRDARLGGLGPDHGIGSDTVDHIGIRAEGGNHRPAGVGPNDWVGPAPRDSSGRPVVGSTHRAAQADAGVELGDIS